MIPIFRAKKLDSDEYVQGWYSSPILISGKLYVSITNTNGEFSIDTTTLSIHFPNMIDSQGNKIFASLQEDGKGGDICQTIDCLNGTLNGVAIYDNFSFRIHRIGKAMGISFTSKDIKIIGIKE